VHLVFWQISWLFLTRIRQHTDEPTSQLPHITWCPTGPLTSLPLHADGIYEFGRPRLYNHAISSYTPSLSALLTSPKPLEGTSGSILAISQTQDGLQKTEEEVQMIRDCFGKDSVVWLNRERATVKTVLDHMRKHRWVHFACHAKQNVKDPMSSHFRLYDGILEIAHIMKESFNGNLAFLSACETATGDETLPEESIHLAAGIMMAGYPAVIGTLWSINDDDAPLVARKVYSHLYHKGIPDSSQAAYALHDAVACLRIQDEQNFLSWVPFIHLGK
jgi:CHAT domain-containing protein